MWELDNKKGWVPKNWCLRIVVLEMILGSPLDCKEIKPVNLKGNQPWIFTGRTVAEAEAPIHWPPDAKSWLIGKVPDEERLKAGGEGENRGWGDWMASLTQWAWVWANSGMVKDKGSLCAIVHGVTKSQTWLNDWTAITVKRFLTVKLVYTNKKRKDVGIKVFPTNSMVPKREKRNILFTNQKRNMEFCHWDNQYCFQSRVPYTNARNKC